ncbi:MAG: zinc ribbon domain-containing protein [Chlamydiales bacterium]
MHESFQTVLKIQEFDIKMIRLLRVKKDHQKELSKIQTLKSDIHQQVKDKEEQITEVKKEIRSGETKIKEIQEKVTKLEGQQAAVKKMDEFNALTQEMTAAGRERTATEHRLSDLMDQLTQEEDLLVTLKENLESTEKNSELIEKEIHESIEKINIEGRELLEQRNQFKEQVDPDLFAIYERLLKNKKDRVIVPIENRTCSGCHIVLTPQHENLVRKDDRLVFCEHCSRILYWQEGEAPKGEAAAAPRRRRRRTTANMA